VRPSGSTAAPTWFNLGDQDLATHFYRTARLAEGATLTEVTDEIRRAWDLDLTVLPMTNDRLRTLVTLADSGDEVSFQDYFVRLRHEEAISGIRFDHDEARPTPEVGSALDAADVIVIAPSNPLVSIGPIRTMPGIDDLLAQRRNRVVAVSPIVGGAALKGPADRMLRELGLEPSVAGVAGLYSPVAQTLVIDPADADEEHRVEETGMRCIIEPSVMSSLERARSLAEACLAAAG
jgi:LPPG:FO 2-phospho-L-lactate transferase